MFSMHKTCDEIQRPFRTDHEVNAVVSLLPRIATSSGDTITYEVWFGTDENGVGWQLADRTYALKTTVSGLDSDTTYYFSVKAMNIAGVSEFTTISSTAEDGGEYVLTTALLAIIAIIVAITIWAAARSKR